MKKIKSILKKYSLIFSLLLVIAIIVAGYFLNKNMRTEIKELEEDIRTKQSQIVQYEKDKDKAPSPELITKLSREKEYYSREFDFLRNNFSTTYPIIPEFTLYPAVEYKEFIYFSEDRLKNRADKRRVTLPSDLGFHKPGLKPAEEIPTLTLQFEVVKDLATLIIDSGVTNIDIIDPGVPQNVDFYQVLPIKLSISGSSNEIVRFLKYIENPSSYFILKNFDVKKDKDDLFKVAAGINAVIIEKTETKMDVQG